MRCLSLLADELGEEQVMQVNHMHTCWDAHHCDDACSTSRH